MGTGEAGGIFLDILSTSCMNPQKSLHVFHSCSMQSNGKSGTDGGTWARLLAGTRGLQTRLHTKYRLTAVCGEAAPGCWCYSGANLFFGQQLGPKGWKISRLGRFCCKADSTAANFFLARLNGNWWNMEKYIFRCRAQGYKYEASFSGIKIIIIDHPPVW